MQESMIPQSMQRPETTDSVADRLQGVAQTILTVVFGFLPIFFIPSSFVPFEYTKVMFALTGLLLALIFYSLSVLRSGTISVARSMSLGLLWAVVLGVSLSGLLSGDLRDAFLGDVVSVHTGLFVAIIALTTSVWMLVGVKKEMVMRLYVFLAISTLILVVYHVLRILFGADFLTLGVFTSSVSSPLGGWNDLALFLGLSILLSLIALEQLPLTKSGSWFFGGVTSAALVMLAVINFSTVWIILGLVSVVLLVYALGRHRFVLAREGQTAVEKSSNTIALVISASVFVVSALFILGGSNLGSFVSGITNISYVEVRPSVEATTDIVRATYSENAFVGVGPNRFADAWRMHKDPSINSTIFWNTSFNTGSGYIPTFFVTTGVIGGVLWVVFLSFFVGFGIRLLTRTSDPDPMWYFIASSSYVSAVYIWFVSLMYTPGASIILIGALCTGITIAASTRMGANRMLTISVGANRRTGFVLTLVVMAVIIGSVSSLYGVGRHYASAYTFNKATGTVSDGQNIDIVEQGIADAFALYQNDVFARRIAELQLARMNVLVTVPEPTPEQEQQFLSAAQNAVQLSQLAIDLDPTNPDNYTALGAAYTILTRVGGGVEEYRAQAEAALTRARDLDPTNPARHLALAQLAAQVGDLAVTRTNIEAAITRKPDYGEALFLLTQLDIAEGNIEGAIAASRAIIQLDPQNPARYYQLGFLEFANGNATAAVVAFEAAIRLDPEYANARYFLALSYDSLGRAADAKAQLEVVRDLNPDNAEVQALIDAIDQNGTLGVAAPQALNESQPVTDTSSGTVSTDSLGDVTTDTNPDTPLVTPVNVPPASEESGESAEAPAPATQPDTSTESDSSNE